MILSSLIIAISSFLMSMFLTYKLINFSKFLNLIDTPNKRSSHKIPTSKGGGISIVLLTFIAIIFLYFDRSIDTTFGISLILGSTIIAITGFLDDLYNLSVIRRIILYSLSIFISIIILVPETNLVIGNTKIEMSVFAYLVYAVYIFWLMNLFNFMDGTDGYAGIQTVSTAFFTWLVLSNTIETNEHLILLVILASTLGFLIWNWSPAKIFMGDVGSCTLGFIFALFSVYSSNQGHLSISVWLILLSPFIGDASFTLIKEILNGKKWYQAHNNHAYQKLYQIGFNHRVIAKGLLVINLICIWPLAYIAIVNPDIELYILLICYCFIAVIWSYIFHYHNKQKNVVIKNS